MSEQYIPNGYSLTPELSSERVTSFGAAGQGTEPGKAYAIVLETSKGRMVAELYADQTPITVNSMVWLTRHHYYDGIVFHRVLEGFMAQTGDPSGTGSGGPGYKYGLEIRNNLKFNTKGVIGMARTQDPNSNGSQFFITFAPTPSLDAQYTVFGKIIEGLDVLDSITRIDPSRPSFGIQPDSITRAYVVEKND